jgi:hypothetical protein
LSDNVDITPGSGATVATDDVGGFQHQRVKLSLGADGSATDALGGAGSVAAGVQRTTLASDDPAVALLGTIDADTGAIMTALQIMDDWDETNRAAVNIIAGQVGVAGGTGTDGATVQRVSLATNVALPAGTNNIGDVDVLTLPAIPAGTNLIGRVKPEGDEYETVAASQTAQTLGATGGTGDYIAGILVVPANLNPGNVLLLDNATSITVFAGGTGSVSNLIPFFIPLGMTSVSGAWKITTGASVSCIGIGNFT